MSSKYFGKRSPSPSSPKSGKRNRFLFNLQNDNNNDNLPPTKIAKIEKNQDVSSIKVKKENKNNCLSPSIITKSSPNNNNKLSPLEKLNQFAHKKQNKIHSPFQQTNNEKSSKLITKQANIKSPIKYTPLEQQVIQLWKDNPGVLLAVEVGYKYIFFGEDAVKASKVLNFVLTPKRKSSNFQQCMVPTVTLHVHLHRLVNAGLKVGIVTQTETSALKKVGTNRYSPFTRVLSQIYTKGTFISPKIDRVIDNNNNERKSGSADSGFLLCFCESNEHDIHSRKQVNIGILAVNVCTGAIIYDYFNDEFLRSELENRLASIQPTELIIPESKYLSTQSETLINSYYHENVIQDENKLKKHSNITNSSNNTNNNDKNDINEYDIQYNAVRIERVPLLFDNNVKTVNSFYENQDFVNSLPNLVIQCLGQMIDYLKSFGLEKLFNLTNNFSLFSQDNLLPMDKNTITQLEILENNDGNKKQNLFWLIDATLTSFGSRLLRSWLLHPMKYADTINSRLDAIEELIKNGNNSIKTLLNGLPDLERGICRIFYHKCEPLEFITIMKSFLNIFNNLKILKEETYSSELLSSTINSIPDLSEKVSYWLSCLNINAAREDKLTDLFQFEHLSKDPYPNIKATKTCINTTKQKLNDILAQLRNDTGFPRLKYITIAKDEYLVELTLKQSEKVPGDWIFVNKTKVAKRYHTPRIKQQYAILCQNRELLNNEINNAWKHFIDTCKESYYDLRTIVVKLSILDCLLALSIKGKQANYVRPNILSHNDSSSTIIIKDGRHPVVESFIGLNTFVPNDTILEDNQKCIMLTGPNMGGKSCYMKQVALIVLLAQIGSFVPASSVTLTPVDRIMVRMGAQDSIEQGKSTFFVEMQETSDILQKATSHSLVLFDELGRGTSTHDGVAIADSTFRYILSSIKCFTLFVTHYHLLCQTAAQYPLQSTCYHMSFYQNPDEDDKEYSITFLYKLTKGIAGKSYGLNVAKLAGIPDSIINNANNKSQQLAGTMRLIDTTSSKENKISIENILKDYKSNNRSKESTYKLLKYIWEILKTTHIKQYT